MGPFLLVGERVGIRRPVADDCGEFVALMRQSADMHYPWGEYPTTPEKFTQYLQRRALPDQDGFLVCERESGAIAGVININSIVRGFFQSGYLGYYGAAPFARRGYMTEGMKLVIRFAFDELKLHRLEANIQPENVASIALVRRCGFRKEGFSPRYLKILGEWRDHERWALLADDSIPS
jgi:[ribosomal protein S5]-alanine N-acetyltransferase